MAVIIDADGLVVGRLATSVAKQLLKGDEVVILNAEKAIIAGSRDAIVREFKWRRRVGSERKGPYYPRMPDRILRRAVRGMLPYRRKPGKDALHRLEVYIGVPGSYADSAAKAATVENARKPGLREWMSLGDISNILGANL
jgi:large subunit ribosomal protein L13